VRLVSNGDRIDDLELLEIDHGHRVVAPVADIGPPTVRRQTHTVREIPDLDLVHDLTRGGVDDREGVRSLARDVKPLTVRTHRQVEGGLVLDRRGPGCGHVRPRVIDSREIALIFELAAVNARLMAALAFGPCRIAEADRVRGHWVARGSLLDVIAPRPMAAFALNASGQRRAIAGAMAFQTGPARSRIAIDTFRGRDRPRPLGPEGRVGLGVASQTPFARHVAHGLSSMAGSADHHTDDVGIVTGAGPTGGLSLLTPESRVGDLFHGLVVVEGLHLDHRGVGELHLVADHAQGLGVDHDLGRHVLASRAMATLALNTVCDMEGRVELPRLGVRSGRVAPEADRAFEGVLLDPRNSRDLGRLGKGERRVGARVRRPVPRGKLVALEAVVTLAADLGSDVDRFGGPGGGCQQHADRENDEALHFFFAPGSVTVRTRLASTFSRIEVLPLGHLTSMRSTVSLAPRPKWARGSL
jgi:hypothetical protein